MSVKRWAFSRTSRNSGWTAGIALILVSLGAPARAETGKPAPAPGLQVTVERLGNFYYAGDPALIRVAVFNTGKTPYDNSNGIDLLGNMIVGDKSGGLKHKPGGASNGRNQPAVIAPGGFFGFIADLRDIVEGLDKPGNYAARFQSPGLDTDAVSFVVIPRYDAATAYRATIDTDYGALQFDLFGKEAPAHVHNFYDLGNQEYYDGTLFHLVVKGIEIRGGDKTGNGDSGPGYSLQTEIDKSMKHTRGTLSMFRGETGDHGSQFLITLADNPRLDGQVTIFGTLAGGDEALSSIENLPTNGQKGYPYYRPLKDARIRSIRVAPAPPGSRATAEGVGAKATPKP